MSTVVDLRTTGLTPARLNRTLEQWSAMRPAFVADSSSSAIVFTLLDAQHDLLELLKENGRLREHIRSLEPPAPEAWTIDQVLTALDTAAQFSDGDKRREWLRETLEKSGWKRLT